VFGEKGYDAASIRDISRESRTSLAGLYYYFKSKEELLYLIQKDAFTTLLARANERLATVRNPQDRLRVFVDCHLSFFLEQPERSKVLSNEDETVSGALGA